MTKDIFVPRYLARLYIYIYIYSRNSHRFSALINKLDLLAGLYRFDSLSTYFLPLSTVILEANKTKPTLENNYKRQR